jgi:uncharacterized membrane protein
MAKSLGRVTAGPLPGISEVTMAHLYRAEVQRSTAWRTRLDTTTNWALTATAAVVSFAFGVNAPHSTLLVGVLLVLTFLGVEARRYRYYDMWARRVRLIESGYLSPLVRREPIPGDFYGSLANELSRPRLRISNLESLAFRLRRTYFPILALLLAAWPLKLDHHPYPAGSFGEVLDRADIGPVPGAVTFAGWAMVCAALLGLYVYSRMVPMPPTELRAPARHGQRPLGSAFGVVMGKGRVRLPNPPTIRPASAKDRLG